MNVELKPINTADYVEFFGVSPTHTIRGYCFYLDGRKVAVFGAILEKECTMLFSNMKEDINVPKITIWRWAKKSLRLIDDMRQPLYATSKNSGKFLNSLGFVFRGDTKYGKLYEYLG